MEDADNTQFQALYRRFRPSTFAQVLGQPQVTVALRNAVRDQRVAHAYLFSGPRGTGKTSTARILAKALNCLDPQDGEPCGVCASCLSVAAGSSFDVVELDAASNRGIDEVRDLIQSTALVTGGNWRVFIVDEVHMLSSAAAAALLKTLEEPPPHVVFVLATTDPQKVSATIRSRTQHYEFRLLPTEVLGELLASINDQAGLGLDSAVLETVVRRGKGSARDALSTLDAAAAGGMVTDESVPLFALLDALADRDAAAALAAFSDVSAAGSSPRVVGEELVSQLRDALLCVVAPTNVDRTPEDRKRLTDLASRFELARITSAITEIGDGLRAMRDAVDQRIPLEVSLVKITLTGVPVVTVAAPVQTAPTHAGPVSGSSVASALSASPPASSPSGANPASAARASLNAIRGQMTGAAPRAKSADPKLVSLDTASPAQTAPAASATRVLAEDSVARLASAVAASSADRVFPSLDDLATRWNQSLLGALPGRVKSRFSTGRWYSVDAASATATFAVANEPHRQRCDEFRVDVQQSVTEAFGRTINVKIVVDPDSASSTRMTEPGHDTESSLIDEVRESGDTSSIRSGPISSPEERLLRAFPGAEEVSS